MEGFELFMIVLLTIGMSTAQHSCTPKMMCPSDWEPWCDSCYKLTTKHLTWADAGSMCKEMGGEMAAPSSKEELEYMRSKSGNSWINCNDMETDGRWVCQNGGEYIMDLYKNDEVPIEGSGENCALTVDGVLEDVSCTSFYLAVCKGEQVQMKSWRLLASCLMGYIIQEFQTNGVRTCAVTCAYNPACRSFNVLHFGDGEKLCQLNNATRFDADQAQFMKMDNLCIYGEK